MQIGSESEDKIQLKIDLKHISGPVHDANQQPKKSIMTFDEESLGTNRAIMNIYTYAHKHYNC